MILRNSIIIIIEIILLSGNGDIRQLENKLHSKHGRPDTKDIEEALLVAIQNGHDFCIPSLVVAGARRLDCALYLAIQLERVNSIAILLLCKATITGDCAVIRSLLSEPPESDNAPWYMVKVHSVLSRGAIKMSYPIAVSIIEKNYEATKELLLRTDLDMRRKQVDWSKLKLTLLHPSWVYSIAPWVVSLKLVNNHLRKIPVELFRATQLRRLDLSQNLLEIVPIETFALPNLEYLNLSQNRIKEITDTNHWTSSLLSLDLGSNLLTTLPPGIQNSAIEILNISKNHFTMIPKCLCRITTLTSLDLSSTQITSFPPEMQHLEHLVNLNVNNANINDFPGGTAIIRGAVKGVFKARARSSKTSNHIKLVLLCNSDRVKSAMLSRLKPHFNSSEKLPEFDQFQWSYRPIFTRKLFGTHKLHFNTWLLGSSYECHSIYPCFFTSGALYILVWDITKSADMREQIKVYVDNLVRYVPYSNILVINILPEGYEGWLDSHLDNLAKRLSNFFSKPMYSTLVYHGLMMVVAKPNVKDSQSDIKQQIYDIASTMSVNGQLKIGRQYPETYFHLIPVLNKEQQMFQARDKPGVLEENTIWTMFDKALSSDLLHREELPVMVDFLQESGFLLHFEDPNERLDQYYFTRPVWLYHTLVRIVHHALQHSTRIEMTYNDLCFLANVSWSKDVSSALIRLMTRYAIVLPTRNNSFVINCLLPHCVPPSAELFIGSLRRQFAPKSRGLPCDLWIRVICRVLTNLSRITDVSDVREEERGSGSGGRVLVDVQEEDTAVEAPRNSDETKIHIVLPKRLTYLERSSSTPNARGAKKPSLLAISKGRSLASNIGDSWEPGKETVDDSSLSSSTSSGSGKPSALTLLQISNRDRIEESDDGLTPMDEGKERSITRQGIPEEGSSLNKVSNDGGDGDDGEGGPPHKPHTLELKDLIVSTTKVEGEIAEKALVTPDDPFPPSPTQKQAQATTSQSRDEIIDTPTQKTTTPQSKGAENTDPKPNSEKERSNDANRLQRNVSMPARRREARSGTSTQPASLERGLWVWDSGIIYNRNDVKFSIYPCRSDMSAVEEKGIEICSNQTPLGKTVFARLCRVVQQLLQERYPDMYSIDLLLHKHELTQLSICPVCLESGEKFPTSFLVEACVHSLFEKSMHNCRYHPEAIPLNDLIPDYLMVDFPSKYHLGNSSFKYAETQPLHQGKSNSLYQGLANGVEVAIKVYHQVDGKSITLPLSYIRQELEMLSTLEHPNIVQLHGYSLQPPCVMLEKAPLGNLYQRLMDTEQRISRIVRFNIACQVLSTLTYLHKRDVIYRTLKASSILVWSLEYADEVNIKLANFERAQFKSPSGLLGKTSFASYPAPEMLRYSFREEYSEKVDIYSFGILLYELVTRWHPFGGIYYTERIPSSQRPKLSGINTTGYSTLVHLMEECWQEDATLRPSAYNLLMKMSMPSFQCHIATQVLRDCTSVRDCCFVPSVRQVWVYGEYNRDSGFGDGDTIEGTQVFILNADSLTIQGTLEFKERVSAVFTVDCKVWIGMTEACVHAYDTTTFRFTDRFKLSDSVTVIADNDSYVFVAQANGHLSCFPKLAQKESQVIDVEIGSRAIIAMITVNDILWLSCGSELVILSADDEVTIEERWLACDPTEQIYSLVLSMDDTIVWSIVKGSHFIISWDVSTGKMKHNTDLSEDIRWVCCELNYDPTYLRLVSLECVQDTLWLGLTCGVIIVLTATEIPKKITYFRAHRSAPKVIMEIPSLDETDGQESPVVLTGGFGEVSTMSSTGSEHSGVIMSWHALRAEDCKLVAKRHVNYIHSNR